MLLELHKINKLHNKQLRNNLINLIYLHFNKLKSKKLLYQQLMNKVEIIINKQVKIVNQLSLNKNKRNLFKKEIERTNISYNFIYLLG
jgi:hypothetical protein